jgi:hypothetical protein
METLQFTTKRSAFISDCLWIAVLRGHQKPAVVAPA